MTKKWILLDLPDTATIDKLKNELNLDTLLCTLLIQRGVHSLSAAKTFFRPDLSALHDPFDMKGMDIAVERLTKAIFGEEKIMIYGDYDVDGTTSVALVYNFLKTLSPNIFTYIPDRYIEGYGVSRKGMDWAIEHGVKLIITLDCGIRAVENIGVAANKKIDVIVCDHHLPGDELPDAIAILDPKQKDCDYPYDELSGCGIGFKFMEAFSLQNGIDDRKLLNLLDLVAVSIASDIVPITGENRLLAWFGMKKINQSPLPGLAALMDKAQLAPPMEISHVVFGLGPRINAAGRISHANTALDLLTQDSKEEAKVFAEKLDLENNERKNYDQNITADALQMIIAAGQDKNQSTVLFKDSWHKGVIGIVASRCIEHHYKPTIIMTESNGKVTGSARSVTGFDIHHAIECCSEHLLQFGGHKYAAGLTMEKSALKGFKEAFEKVVSEQIKPESQTAQIKVDMEIGLEQIGSKMYSILKQMGPFGPMNMQPVFCSKNVLLVNDPRVLKDKHLKLMVTQAGTSKQFDAIGFGLGEFHNQLDAPFDMVYTIEENHFRGRTTLQLMLKDLKI